MPKPVCSDKMEEEAKKIFFRELYQLDDEESEVEDSSNVSLILKSSKISQSTSRVEKGTPQDRLKHSSRPNPPLKHTVLAPLLPYPVTTLAGQGRPTASQSFPSTICSASPTQQVIDASSGVDDAGRTSTALIPRNGKRKRGRSLSPKPASFQIFMGLSFFFLPNDDVAPARKFRISKAMEFGALWVREWREGITHVVVDRGLCYQDILSFLKVSSLPSNVVVVNEDYPPNCISHHFGDFTVSSDPQHYRVKGHEFAVIAQQLPTAQESFSTSLQLKPGKASTLPPQQTLSRTESSEQQPFEQIFDDHAGVTVDPSESSLPTLVAHPQNALDVAIQEAKAIQYLPLDLNEDDKPDDIPPLGESDGQISEDEREVQKKAPKGVFNKSWQQRFTCMSRHDGAGKSDGPNVRTIEILQEMANYYERYQDHWRFTAYRKAIGALRKQTTKVTSAREASKIPFIGERLADKIEEIIWTDRLRRLENTNSEPMDEAFQLFMKIYGVGLKQATQWIDQGHRKIADLVANASLTKNQKIGVEHFEDFQTRIPRHEMDYHDKYVRESCSNINASVHFTIGGSYRRGAADSGDVDFIVTKPDGSINVLRTIVLKTLIPHLFDKGYLKVGLATTDEESGSKWHGAAALPGERVWRRIDFLLVPWQEVGAALIYFTGNDIFNRSIRLLARKQGLRLNQCGLWKDVIWDQKRGRTMQGSLVESKDERKIFELLGVPWRPPQHRVC